jgi:predicted metal-dependent HD superfamily phosphohydrolase
MHEPHETLQQLWLKHARGIGIEAPSMALLSRLVAAWSQPQRHYHALRHLQECLQGLERWGRELPARHEVGVALWFHDAIYEPERDNNEERSARWAGRSLRELGVADEVARRIGKMIRATRHLSARAADAQVDGLDLLLDIDLSILGADRARFEEYERQVRLEYAHVPDDAFARGRADFVARMLQVQRLYRTEAVHAELEARARDNLQRSLRSWRLA